MGPCTGRLPRLIEASGALSSRRGHAGFTDGAVCFSRPRGFSLKQTDREVLAIASVWWYYCNQITNPPMNRRSRCPPYTMPTFTMPSLSGLDFSKLDLSKVQLPKFDCQCVQPCRRSTCPRSTRPEDRPAQGRPAGRRRRSPRRSGPRRRLRRCRSRRPHGREDRRARARDPGQGHDTRPPGGRRRRLINSPESGPARHSIIAAPSVRGASRPACGGARYSRGPGDPRCRSCEAPPRHFPRAPSPSASRC